MREKNRGGHYASSSDNDDFPNRTARRVQEKRGRTHKNLWEKAFRFWKEFGGSDGDEGKSSMRFQRVA